ncbi:MAG: 4Fe-4S binding protein [Prevotellaceae bacterium]|jgi:Na+-translocating ferredoxin:NAD+ oxidoreductase RNF subunit RnfB|nr:4Fe-4S binding protein [Prevotellaceae bacterium]
MSENVIQLDKSKCKACYSCIRACPVKAIHVGENSVFPYIEEHKCIVCGTCIGTCAYDAITYSDSKKGVKELLNAKEKVVAICAPSIAGEFDDITDYRKFVKMIRLLGFTYVMEMAFGVDIIAEKYRRLTHDEFNGKYYITSCCPSIVKLIEKFYPQLIPNLVPYVSPIAACAIVARKIYGENLKVVQITPCVAAKKEMDRNTGLAKVNEVLTFRELRELFSEYKISETFTEYSDFDEPLGYKGSMYPISQGFLEAAGLDLRLLKEDTITAEGKSSVHAVKQFWDHYNAIKHNFNIFFCEGCIMGPGTSEGGEKFKRYAFVKDYITRRLSNFDIQKWQNYMDAHSHYKELEAVFVNKKLEVVPPDDFEVKIALNRITKRNNNKEVNCGACGFDTCLGLAQAIAQHIAITEMCVTNAQIGNREASHSSKRTYEELEMVKSELSVTKSTLEEVRELLFDKNEALTIFIRGLSAGIVFCDENLKITESNLGFIEILGEDVKDIHEVIPYLIGADLKTLLPPSLTAQFQFILNHDETQINKDVEIDDKLINVSIFQLVQKKLVGAVLRNLHSKEERPEEIIHRVTEVIEENLRQVQQMGFILGEGAAKTEKMLNSIIKSYK